MTTFKPGDVVERAYHHPQMPIGTRHIVENVKVESFDGVRDVCLSFRDESRWWAAENFRLIRSAATVGKLRLFPASTALARGR